ncbi:MAG: RpiB/LacA/LacB family sugar-phosphate isomerase [Hungatella sp.]|nr:RpiB/LacA/LacB family sugar-phosphate isomerase [Hungatella sp.]
MKIALVNESSQVSKNQLVYEVLKDTVLPLGHEVFNYGMSEDDQAYNISYVEAGLLSAVLLNSHAVDFVITGCGTGEGACLAANIYPNVYCGYVKDPSDAFLFSQINSGNAVSLPLAKEFGWCAELNLKYVFRELFSCEHGMGYPPERGPVQKEFRDIFYKVKGQVSKEMLQILKDLDRDILTKTFGGKNFRSQYFRYVPDSPLKTFMAKLA